jgi:hypothetical protein
MRGFRIGALAPDGRVGSNYLVVAARPDPSVTVELVAPRPLVLSVLDAGNRRPIAGAVIEVNGTEESWQWHGPHESKGQTDAAGKVRLSPPPVGSRIPVWIRAGGFEECSKNLSPSALPEIEILLKRKPAQRWTVTDSPARPADGSEVAVYSVYDPDRAKPFAGTVANGELTVPWGAPERELGLAIAKDGAFADIYHDGPTVFRRPRDVDLELRWDDGAPAAGIRLLILEPLADPLLRDRVVTDQAGRARVTVLAEREMSWMWRRGQSAWYLDSVAVADGENHGRAVINRLTNVTLRLTLDREKRLPADLNLGCLENLVRPFVQDPTAATISFEYRQIWRWQPLEIWIYGHGFPTRKLWISSPPGSSVVRDVALRTGITLRIPLPKSQQTRIVYLVQWDAEQRRWRDWGSRPVSADQPWAGDSPVEIRDLEPGFYRIESDSDRSRTIELRDRPAIQTVLIDFTRWVRYQGRIEATQGLDLARARVVPLAPDDQSEVTAEAALRDGLPVNERGSFDFFLIGAEKVRLVPWHPAASPTPSGSVTVESGADPVILRLGPPLRSARFTADLELPSDFQRSGSIRVLPLDDQGRALGQLEAVPAGNGFQVANLAAETKALFVDPPSELSVPRENDAPIVHRLPARVPSIVKAAGVGETQINLGRLSFATGSTLVLGFPEAWPRPIPPLEVTAEALEAPSYTRRLTTSGEAEARLSGLRKGSFRITVQAHEQYSFRFERVIQADGDHPVVIAVDSPVNR